MIRFQLLAASMLFLSAQAAAQAGKGDAALGEYLSSECVTCHQKSGQVTAGVPAITGWPEDQFVAVLQSYKDKHRDNVTMQTIAGRLSAEDMAALAAYFGKLKAVGHK
jgi:cytochrome c